MPKTPQQIDLSQNLESQGITLSESQQANYQEYLATLEEAERNDIIYLTTQELNDFKQALEYENNHHRDRNEVIDEFVQQQVAEGLSLSDIMGEDFEHTEELDVLDNYTKEILFGNEGMLSSLDISSIAQDSLSFALSLSLIGKLASGEINVTNIQEASGVEGSDDFRAVFETIFGETLVSNISEFKTLADTTEQVPGSSETMSRLFISGNGETNSIFMNPEEGKDFFDALLEGAMSQEEIELALESKNNSETVGVTDFSAIKIELGENLSQIEENLERGIRDGSINHADMAQAAEDLVSNPRETEDPEELGLLAMILQAIRDLMSSFTDGLDRVLGDSENNGNSENSKTNTEAEEIAPTRIDTLRNSLLSRVSEGAFIGITEASIQEFLNGEGNMEQFLRVMHDIPTHNGQDTLEEKIENLLFSNITTSRTPKLLAFIEASDSELGTIVQEDGSLNSQNFMLAVTEYGAYREAYNQEETPLTYSAYFENRGPDNSQ